MMLKCVILFFTRAVVLAGAGQPGEAKKLPAFSGFRERIAPCSQFVRKKTVIDFNIIHSAA